MKSQESANGDVVMAGTIHEIRDETPVDGPVRIALVDEHGQLRKVVFGSLFSSPPPSEHRKAVYERVAVSKKGNCVKVTGKKMEDGRLGRRLRGAP